MILTSVLVPHGGGELDLFSVQEFTKLEVRTFFFLKNSVAVVVM